MTSPASPGRPAARALGDPRALPSRAWLAHLTARTRREIDGWLAETDGFVATERSIRAAHRAGGRSFYAQFRAPLDLYALVRALRPSVVVETGVSSGVSSAHLLLALRKNRTGRLISIDLPSFQKGPTLRRGESPVCIPPGRSSGWAVPATLRNGWDLRIGPAQELIPEVARRERRVDLFLHDDLHTPEHLAFELRTLRRRFRPGSIVLADNTVWTGDAFPRFARSVGVPYFRRRRSDFVGLRMPGPSDKT